MADELQYIKIPELTVLTKSEVGTTADLIVNLNGVDHRIKSGDFLIDIINNLTESTTGKALDATQGLILSNLIQWQDEVDGFVFDYESNWTIATVGITKDLNITIPDSTILEPNSSTPVSINGVSATVEENGGIVLSRSGGLYSYSFVNDLTDPAWSDGVADKYVIVKNLNGTLYTRNASLAGAIPSTGQVSSPNSSTDGKVTLFEGTTGKILKESRIGETEINRSNRSLMRAFANGIFHEFEFEIIEDGGTIYAEVWPTITEWLIGTSYTKYNSIHYGGYKYTAIKDSTGVAPNTDYTIDPTNTTASWYRDEEWDGNLHGTLDGTDRVYTLNTTTGAGINGHARVALTGGTPDEPQLNLVYCTPIGDTRVMSLTSSLTLPLGGVVFIGYAGVWDAASHSGGRAAFPQQRFTNAFYKDSIEKSLIGAIREVTRRRGITHAEGTIGSCVITTSAGLDSLDLENTSGLVYQLWPHLFPSNASALNLYQFNSYDAGGNKLAILSDLNEIVEAADGTSLRTNNARYALEFFGIINSGTGVVDALAVNVSDSIYSSDALCVSDAENKSVTTVPDNYYLTAFRICRIPLKYSTANGGTIINLLGTTEVQDRRKWSLGGSGGGAAGGGVINHDDLNNIMPAAIGNTYGHVNEALFKLINKTQQTLTSSAAISMNIESGLNAYLSLGITSTLTLSNLVSGAEGNIIVDNTGTYELTISPTPYVINDGAGVIELTDNGRTILSYYYDGTALNITYGLNYTNS